MSVADDTFHVPNPKVASTKKFFELRGEPPVGELKKWISDLREFQKVHLTDYNKQFK